MKRTRNLLLALCILWLGCAPHTQQIQGDNITLLLRAPQARRVVLVCSLDGFRPRAARQDRSGRWSVTLPAGAPFTYFYHVDGRPFTPDCPLKEKDDFGSQNCIFDPRR